MCLIKFFFSFTISTNKEKHQVITMQELLLIFFERLIIRTKHTIKSKETELFNRISLSYLITGNITRKH